ncbi:putative dual specificity protein phosphatase 16-like [Triplophysa rosa]|uniref:protein-tyrosine-phosphatase n=1 Tax=Triplophysa rosa TaxID=992332 RepID=A0A9W7WKT5_TRIRA|nr:putative dual specificity protein phosphatase 16-like [Triplophysa rosa]
MVYYRNSESERPPVSRILPHLYLGAETDVTQDGLSDRGISYVLSVSRCCPQPSFLPQSQYLRIPIDDSLRDDLLPWIPRALHFIDGAMSLGCSVLVHCAAGISRSPALAVAYVMYSMKMDLDHAYRFVKERRPTISPNFNFLGQLQLFQETLPLKNNTNFTQQSAKPLDNCLQATNEENLNSSAAPLLTNLNLQSNNCIIYRQTDDVNCENRNNQLENIHSQHHEMIKPELTLSLSDKLGSLTLHTNSDEVQRPIIPCQTQQGAPKSIPPKPTCLQIPSARISLAEKRKCLTLSLTPVSAGPQAHHKVSTANSSDLKQSSTCSSSFDQKGAFGGLGRANKERPAAETRTEPKEANKSRREASARHSCSRSHKKKSKLNGSRAKEELPKAKTNLLKPEDISSTRSQRQIQGGVTTPPQEVLEREVTGGVEAVESMDGNQSPLSPVSLTVNKILDWGERMLLGVLLGPRIKMGQAALPYRC